MPQAAAFSERRGLASRPTSQVLLPLRVFVSILKPETMFSNLLSALAGSTDGIVASFLKPELEKHLAGIGKVQNIKLDTPNKRASVTLAMDGDPNPVKIEIERYSLSPSTTGCLLTIHDYSSPTHEWLAKLGKKFLPTFEIPLPVPYAMATAIV